MLLSKSYRKIKKYTFLLFFLSIIVSCKKTEYSLIKIEGKQIAIFDSIQADENIEAFIAPYKESVNKNLTEVLAYNTKDMIKTDGELNSTIGNMMSDIVMQEANPIFNKRTQKNIDFVLLNYGGIRAPIPKGDVTQRSAYNIMPFENEIVVLELTSASILKMLDYLSVAKTAHPVAGMEIEFNSNYELENFTIQGKPLDSARTYFVATSDYLRNGGDNMLFFQEAVSETPIDYKLRNAIIDYFKKTDTLDFSVDNRFIRKQ